MDRTTSKLHPRHKHRLKRLARLPVDYVWNWHLKGHLLPWKFGVRVWRLGWALRTVIGAILILAALAAFVGRFHFFHGFETSILQGLFLAVCSLVFGTSTAAAAGWGIGGVALVAPWLAYFAMAGTNLLGTTPLRPLIAFPVWTLLAVAWRLAVSARPQTWTVALWIALAMGTGLLTSGVTGFRQALGLDWPTGGSLLGSLLALMGGLAWWQFQSRVKPPAFGSILLLSSASLAGPLAASAWHEPNATVSWVVNQFPQLDFLVTLFWLWSGGGFAMSLFKTVDWTTKKAVRVGLARLLVWGAPLVWIVAAGLEYALALAPAARMSATSHTLDLRLAARAHFILTLLSVGLFLWWRWIKGITARRIIDLNSLWIVSFFGLLAVMTKLSGFTTIQAQQALTGAALAASILGVLSIVSRMERDWSSRGPREVALYIAWGGAFIAILFADQLDPTWRIDQNMSVQVFEGMLTLGLPLIVHHRIVARSKGATRPCVLVQLTLIVLGMLVAFAVMHLNYADWPWLGLSLPLWIFLLCIVRRLHPAWDRLAGAMAGVMLAAGTTLYWRIPIAFCIPFRPGFPSIETLAEWYRARGVLSLEAQLGLTLAGIAAGALSGWMVFRGRKSFIRKAA